MTDPNTGDDITDEQADKLLEILKRAETEPPPPDDPAE